MNPNRTPRQPQPPPATDSPSTPVFTPGQPSSTTNGPKTVELSAEKVVKTDIHDLIKEGLARLPETAHYEFLHKLRTAKMFHEGHTGRDSAVAIRLLSIANIGYVHVEKEFMAKLGQQDADEPRRLQLAYQLSELVHPPGNGETGISTELQTYTMSALEALAKHKPADLIDALCDGRLAFLRALSTWPRFGRGWSRRVEEVRKAALAMAAEPAPSVAPAKCGTCGKRLAA